MKNKCLECDLTASYNISGQKARYCSKHKKENMINVKHSRCKDENCDSTSPSFNYVTEKKGIYCSTHKKENMINVYKKCQSENCTIYPSYNYQGKTKGIYCNEHKKENMINVVNKKCLEENCNTIPYFNLPDKKTGIYCVKHKKEKMIDVSSKKCKEENCNKKPTYNLVNEQSAIYCAEHKKENMFNTKHSGKCIVKNCVNNSNYNLPREKPLYCKDHSNESMINVNIKKSGICINENCNKYANYNLANNKPLYCKEHSSKNMIDVNHKKCLLCDTIANRKYKGYCFRCFMFTFPNEKLCKNYKIKENHMTDFIKQEFKDQVMVFDKTAGGCSLRRPDCYIDKFTHILVIECDENQHLEKKYTNCDTKRTMEIFQDFGNRPIIFIRFNPDKYINKKGEKIESCFRNQNQLNIPIIKSKKNWNLRLELLKRTISKWIIDIPEKEITYEYLFYDKN